MAWTTFGTHTAGTPISITDGDKISNNVKQLATDIYISPNSGDDGLADLTYPLQRLAPVLSGAVSGTGTTGSTVTLPTGYIPALATDYQVITSWQENPGSNGAIWVEKTTANFVIKHFGTETGKSIGYTVVRNTI
jgi:hypothetical protein